MKRYSVWELYLWEDESPEDRLAEAKAREMASLRRRFGSIEGVVTETSVVYKTVVDCHGCREARVARLLIEFHTHD